LSSDIYVDHAVTEGIKVGKSTLIGTRPLRSQAKVIRVSVSDIPMLTPNMKQVQHDLQTSMSRFGTVLEASLFNDPNGGWFRGRGMVYLDVACADRQLEALLCSHRLGAPTPMSCYKISIFSEHNKNQSLNSLQSLGYKTVLTSLDSVHYSSVPRDTVGPLRSLLPRYLESNAHLLSLLS
jgi:hypothetical protein